MEQGVFGFTIDDILDDIQPRRPLDRQFPTRPGAGERGRREIGSDRRTQNAERADPTRGADHEVPISPIGDRDTGQAGELLEGGFDLGCGGIGREHG